ncbi:prepilin peptidase [Mesorhizobium sp. M2D.F.Ca.ET.223.01.1.1]|uniref:prepilin peptidase n=1 Tax=Mesorhizobium sp. M2D.F.Ca.ET.223.01.1.1 TaxID=2563940 RepID=UPI001092E04C|nr:A24 family peptidase [Mesorhizobium sp. M2D.F.Ca.ET.223.01.1.1]TGR83307.1 prepilin peptidase [Mesorhizobium sp. M2D.F.Ca.ET.223.01.1.1]TGT64440.1 prepilin peptidase [bacterium M00.F.Ca.ET.159.01.1.1]TGT79274.1 prepilin peptidase [bacterium M00.F.Ca.ET.157.01.1.1]
MQTDVAILIVAGLVLAVILVAIAVVDFRRRVIPDWLNIMLAVSGLGFQLAAQRDNAAMQLLVAAMTLAVFWALRRGHLLLTGRIGLGLGDVKMLAAAALWIDPMLLPVLLFIASAAALLFVGGQIVAAGPAAARMRVPFGPFVALGLGLIWALEQVVGLNLGTL